MLRIFGVSAPAWLNNIPLGSTSCSLLAAAIVVICTLLMLLGIKNSSTANIVITSINVGVLLFVVFAGSTKVEPENWTIVNGSFVPYGVRSLFTAAGVVFFSYLGFDTVSTLAEEVARPQVDVPIGIIGSLGISALIYVSVTLVVTGMVPFTEIMNAEGPLAHAFDLRGMDWVAKVIAVGSIAGLTTSCYTGMLGQPRIWFNMARDVRGCAAPRSTVRLAH